jgi:hypothetical protein
MQFRVKVVREHNTMGMLWIQISPVDNQHAPTFICACYIPWPESRYYQNRGSPSCDEHWRQLSFDVAEFKRSGHVLLMGDMNASLLDFQVDDEVDQDQTDDSMGMSAAASAMQALSQHLPARANMDSARPNRSGAKLTELCRHNNLLILNGRLPGNEDGCWTFHGDPTRGADGAVTYKKSSVIDYTVASPQLAFTATGEVMRGCSMQLAGRNPALLPGRPGSEGVFDHAPVGAHVRWFVTRTGRQPPPASVQSVEQCVRWKWREELQAPYVAIIHSSEVQETLRSINSDNMSSTVAVTQFTAAWECAVQKLHQQCGLVIVKTGGTKVPSQPQPNGWYNMRCKEARASLRRATIQYGAGSEQACAARKEYRAAILYANRT